MRISDLIDPGFDWVITLEIYQWNDGNSALWIEITQKDVDERVKPANLVGRTSLKVLSIAKASQKDGLIWFGDILNHET